MTQPKPKTRRSPRKATPTIAKVDNVEPVTPVDGLKDGDVVIKFNMHSFGYAFASGVLAAVLNTFFGGGNSENGANGGDL